MEFDTLLLHGDGRDCGDRNGAVSPPIYQTTALRIQSEADYEEGARGVRPRRFYSRYGNPTLERVASIIAQLEGAETAMLCASGMGAISTTLLAHLKAGDHIVAQRALYNGTASFLGNFLTRFGIETTYVDGTDPVEFEEALRERTVVVYVETPSNPLLRLTDLQAVAAIAKARGILTVCDNTFATPINQRPLDCGIDIVVHSATKYLSGHSDVMAGAIAGSRASIERAWESSLTLGATLGPIDAWLLLRGLRTLALRIERHNANAMELADFLDAHPRIRSVYYPGLTSHPQHALARRQMRGYGGVLSFVVADGFAGAAEVAGRLQLPVAAPSVGAVESLIVHPASLWGPRPPGDAGLGAVLEDGLLRLSVGIESAADLIADFEQALG